MTEVLNPLLPVAPPLPNNLIQCHWTRGLILLPFSHFFDPFFMSPLRFIKLRMEQHSDFKMCLNSFSGEGSVHVTRLEMDWTLEFWDPPQHTHDYCFITLYYVKRTATQRLTEPCNTCSFHIVVLQVFDAVCGCMNSCCVCSDSVAGWWTSHRSRSDTVFSLLSMNLWGNV